MIKKLYKQSQIYNNEAGVCLSVDFAMQDVDDDLTCDDIDELIVVILPNIK